MGALLFLSFSSRFMARVSRGMGGFLFFLEGVRKEPASGGDLNSAHRWRW